jgi:uncharacterized protein (TIGR00730 family)
MAAVKRLCVYCGSSVGADERFRAAGAQLGASIAQAGIELVYGGGKVGLMGIVADAVLAGGGAVTGIIPYHLHRREVAHAGATRLVLVDSMHARKQRMFELADAFVSLPGGLGTLDETIEILTWKQLGLHDKPVLVVDVAGFWRPFVALVEHAIAQGLAPARARQFFRVVTAVADVLPTLAAMPEPTRKVESKLV